MDKKLVCPKCGTKSAIFNPVTKSGKCHICGNEVLEKKSEIIGNFDLSQGIGNDQFRFIQIKVDSKKYKIEDKGEFVEITITEKG